VQRLYVISTCRAGGALLWFPRQSVLMHYCVRVVHRRRCHECNHETNDCSLGIMTLHRVGASIAADTISIVISKATSITPSEPGDLRLFCPRAPPSRSSTGCRWMECERMLSGNYKYHQCRLNWGFWMWPSWLDGCLVWEKRSEGYQVWSQQQATSK